VEEPLDLIYCYACSAHSVRGNICCTGLLFGGYWCCDWCLELACSWRGFCQFVVSEASCGILDHFNGKFCLQSGYLEQHHNGLGSIRGLSLHHIAYIWNQRLTQFLNIPGGLTLLGFNCFNIRLGKWWWFVTNTSEWTG